VFLKDYNTHETILLPCEELKLYSGKPLHPMCKRQMRHAGTTTSVRARAAGDDDDDSDYEGSFSGMQTFHLGRRSVPTVAVCLVLLCRIHSPVLNALTWTC